MIETLSGTSAGSPTELMTMNLPRRSIFCSTEIFIGGSIGTSPSPCHSPISGSNSFIICLLFPGDRVQTIGRGPRPELIGPERRRQLLERHRERLNSRPSRQDAVKSGTLWHHLEHTIPRLVVQPADCSYQRRT